MDGFVPKIVESFVICDEDKVTSLQVFIKN